MTEQQERAYEFLERYHQAKIKERGLDRQVERLRAEAECVRSASAIDLGWTGLTETDKRGRKTKIMAPIPSASSTTGNSKIQNTMCELADKSTDLDLQQDLCRRLQIEIEQAIDDLVEDEAKRVTLKLRHIDRLYYAEIGKTISYSPSHTRKIYYEALQELGAGLTERKDYEQETNTQAEEIIQQTDKSISRDDGTSPGGAV